MKPETLIDKSTLYTSLGGLVASEKVELAHKAPQTISSFFLSMWQSLWTWNNRLRQQQALMTMHEYFLKDIGLTRLDVRWETGTWDYPMDNIAPRYNGMMKYRF